MIRRSTDGKQRVLSLSYGKDSMACLGAIEQLGWPLDRIITADVWATDTIPADLPPMVEFKATADKIILERYGIEVEHYCATKECKKVSYDSCFHRTVKSSKPKYNGGIRGFPGVCFGNWCNRDLKLPALKQAEKMSKNCISFIGIAADEPERLERLDGITKVSPLAEIGWTEADAKQWCIDNGLLSPIYTDSARGGCWFCHNQGVGQLRLLRKNYPELWALLLEWDNDSPVTFHADGHTVHDFDRRFQCEDEGLIYADERFKWADIEQPQMRWF